MLTIPVVPMNPKKESKGSQCISQATLPLFYMSDFSIVGLRVSPYEKAVKVLGKQKHRLVIDHAGVRLVIDNLDGLKEAIRGLQTDAIRCDLSDIAADIYQG